MLLQPTVTLSVTRSELVSVEKSIDPSQTVEDATHSAWRWQLLLLPGTVPVAGLKLLEFCCICFLKLSAYHSAIHCVVT